MAQDQRLKAWHSDEEMLPRILTQISIYILAAFIMVSSPAFAQSKGGGGGSGGWTPTQFEIYLSSGYIGFGKGSTQFDIAPGFQYQFWLPWLQVGAEVTYQKISYQEGSASNLIIQAGPTVNYESFLLSLGFAMKKGSAGETSSTSSSQDDPNGSGFYFMVGKHFVLFPGFSLRPTVGVVATGATSLVVRPFALSYNF